MKALLICPSDRTQVAFLARTRPLALVPVLGRSLLDLWLTELASRGAREVFILAPDRPDQVRHAVGKGEAWGLQVQVIPESRELSVDEARTRHRTGPPGDWMPAPLDITVIDHLPGADNLLVNPQGWFKSLVALIPTAAAQRVGYRQFAPGIWSHVRARISASAHLEPPCWIGAHVSIGSRARVGPDAILEDSVYVDEGAEIRSSIVGPATYVGAMTDLRNSLAWGRGLLNWLSGSFTEVADDFLLGELGRHAALKRTSTLPGRLAALLALVATSPLLLVARARTPKGQPLFIRHRAVRAPVLSTVLLETCTYYELNGVPGLWRRWPELWNILAGKWAWVGNRPLTPEQAADLYTEFERLWLAVPPGIISLADAEGCGDSRDDEGRAHASFYSVQHNLRSDVQIAARMLRRVFSRQTATS